MPLEFKKGLELRDRYVISDLLGSGAFATVWRATDKSAARDVAIKRMVKQKGDELKRLLEEAEKTARVKGHKNIVEMYEVFEQDDDGFLVMEYVDGSTLDEIIRQHILKNTWLDFEEAVDYFKQILQGLLFAHSSGLYHRDVKPSNILISKLGVVKIVDFGLAKPMVLPRLQDEYPEGWACSGTPNFMSPEQAVGGSLDHLTDIFAAGLVGYILFTGRHPFNHPSGITSIFELIKQSGFACGPLVPGESTKLSEGQCRSLGKMLEKNKGQRCQSLVEPVAEFARESAQSCPRCGSPNPKGKKFCGECGSSLAPSTPQPVEVATPPSTPTSASAEELTDHGYQHTLEDDRSRAMMYYQEAIKADPTYARAYSNLGYALNRLGPYEKSIEITTKGLEVASDAVDFHRLYDTRGFARSNLKMYKEAIEDFTNAIKNNETNLSVY